MCACARLCTSVRLRAKLCLCIWVRVYCACWRAGSCANECVCLWIRYTFVYHADKQKHTIRVCTNIWCNYINSQKHHFQLAMHLSCMGAHKYIYDVNNRHPAKRTCSNLISQFTRQRLSGSISPPSGWKTRLRICNQTRHKHITRPLRKHLSTKQPGMETLKKLRRASNRILSAYIVTWLAALQCCSCAARLPMHNLR